MVGDACAVGPYGMPQLSQAPQPPVGELDYDPRELEAFAERFKQRRIKLGRHPGRRWQGAGQPGSCPGVGSLSQSTICRRCSRPGWRRAEHVAMERLKNPDFYGDGGLDKKRKRTSITDAEKRSLEAYFHVQPRPSSEKISQIAEKLNLKKNVVRTGPAACRCGGARVITQSRAYDRGIKHGRQRAEDQMGQRADGELGTAESERSEASERTCGCNAVGGCFELCRIYQNEASRFLGRPLQPHQARPAAAGPDWRININCFFLFQELTVRAAATEQLALPPPLIKRRTIFASSYRGGGQMQPCPQASAPGSLLLLLNNAASRGSQANLAAERRG
uniref:Homeobox domain-containing protein n=1 Tax=Macrostomum lignano TaxID=282301 RepID=A0A1I8JP49_9PLAT